MMHEKPNQSSSILDHKQAPLPSRQTLNRSFIQILGFFSIMRVKFFLKFFSLSFISERLNPNKWQQKIIYTDQFIQIMDFINNVKMNKIARKQSTPTPFFDNKHSKSTSLFVDNAKVLEFDDIKGRKRKEESIYRNIHKKFSENRIDTLEDVLARTLKEIQESKTLQKSGECLKKIQSPSVLQPSKRNNFLHLHSKSNKSFKESVRTFSSEQRSDVSPIMNKRIISEQQLQRVAYILNSLFNKSVKHQFQCKSKHSITEWIRLVHEMEEESKNELNFMQMVNSSKLVLWTEAKIIKTIEAIYESILQRAKKPIINPKINDSSTQLETVSVIIKAFLMGKYKTQKLMKETLANLIYSIEIHLSKRKESKHKLQTIIEQSNKNSYYRLFQEIISLKYQTEDILFYLLSRKIIQSLFQSISQMQVSLNKTAMRDFFKIVTQNDFQLIKEYQMEIDNKFRQTEIDMHTFLTLMIEIYKKKRIKLKMKPKHTLKSPKDEGKYHQRVSNQLSFINYEYDQHFWQIQSPKLLQNLGFKDEILYQAKRLVNMLCNKLSIEYKIFIEELLVIKSINIIESIQNFNKKIILTSLGICEEMISCEQRDIYLRNLQDLRNQLFLTTNHITNKVLNSKVVEKFVKRLLTIPLLSNKLYQLVEYFQKLMQKKQLHP